MNSCVGQKSKIIAYGFGFGTFRPLAVEHGPVEASNWFGALPENKPFRARESTAPFCIGSVEESRIIEYDASGYPMARKLTSGSPAFIP